MMVPGIGVDLLHLPRLFTLLSRRNNHYLQRFARRILTHDELAVFHRKLDDQAVAREGGALVRWLGVRWAAKEAAFKACGGIRGALGWKQVEVGYHPSGRVPLPPPLSRGPVGGLMLCVCVCVLGQPYLSVLWGQERALGGLSISHDGEYVIAMAMLPGTTTTAAAGLGLK